MFKSFIQNRPKMLFSLHMYQTHFLFANLEFTLVFGDSFCCVIALKIIVWKIPHKYIRNVILFYLHMWIRGKEIPVATNKRTAIVITLTIRCYLIWCHKQCSLCHVFSISNMYVNYDSYDIEMQIWTRSQTHSVYRRKENRYLQQ